MQEVATSGPDTGSEKRIYDRQLLPGGAKRTAVLDLWEIQRCGTDSFGDADSVSICGMRPVEWYAKGVRLLGRTAVECTRDESGDLIGKDVAEVAATARAATWVSVVDLFAGSRSEILQRWHCPSKS